MLGFAREVVGGSITASCLVKRSGEGTESGRAEGGTGEHGGGVMRRGGGVEDL